MSGARINIVRDFSKTIYRREERHYLIFINSFPFRNNKMLIKGMYLI